MHRHSDDTTPHKGIECYPHWGHFMSVKREVSYA